MALPPLQTRRYLLFPPTCDRQRQSHGICLSTGETDQEDGVSWKQLVVGAVVDRDQYK